MAEARHVVHQHRTWVEVLARAGYATRGGLYLIVGGLAAMAAFGYGGEATDTQGALLELYRQPFGTVLLALAAVGLAGYAAFLLCRAALDPEGEARDTWGPAKRALWALIGIFHASLAVSAVAMVLGSGSSDDHDENARGLTAELLAWSPLGPILVVAIGAALLIAAGHQFHCAWKAKLDDCLDLSSLSRVSQRWIVRLSRLGIAARACVALVTGTFFIVAAATSNPSEAKGFADSLSALRAMPFGAWIFAGVALGLVAFGCYQLVEARYRRVLGYAR